MGYCAEKNYEEDLFLKLLNRELVVALGCTEPAAIAYAAAFAVQRLTRGTVTELKVAASGNVIKNAMSVNIPGTKLFGIGLAAALGALAGDADKKLEALADITEDDVVKAQGMVEQGRVIVKVADTAKKLFIEVVARSAESQSRVIVADQHTHVAFIEVDGQVIKNSLSDEDAGAEQKEWQPDLKSIWQFINEVDLSKLDIVKESIILNKAAALLGLEEGYGLQVGRSIRDNVRKGLLGDDLASAAMALTAAGSDARMGGCTLPVMSNSGSGNQGLAATLPVVAIGEKLGAAEDKILRAVALSHLVTIAIKTKFGRLSALCGATIAGTGASCGSVYLLGGDLEKVRDAVQNMLGNVTGMLCDGAKGGCAMKVATCTNAAVQSALMAIDGQVVQATDGIVEGDPEVSIDNLCRLGNQGTLEADKIILEIMINKK